VEQHGFGQAERRSRPCAGGTTRQISITSPDRADERPVWTAEGDAVAFMRDGGVYSVAISGAASPAVLILADSAGAINEVAFSPDGDWLVYRRGTSLYAGDIASDTTIPLVEEYNARQPVVSPDGCWLAFQSERSNSSEAYVRPFPGTRGAEWTVSTGGGFSPRWNRDFLPGPGWHALVRHDDSRFLMRRDVDSTGRIERVWVRNWFEELRHKMEGTEPGPTSNRSQRGSTVN
jgi:Tol biopolymer transport system component